MRARDASPTQAGTKGSPALAEVSLLLAVFFVGTDVVSVKYALEGLPPLAFMPARYVLAGLLLLAFLRLLGMNAGGGLGRGDLLVLAGLGSVGITINYVGYTVGLSLTSGSNAALIIATAPVWGLLLGIVLGLERVAPGRAPSGSGWPSRGWPSWWAGAWDPGRRPWGATCSCA
jgi:drug/metabolite transporter (DMT)-like permease